MSKWQRQNDGNETWVKKLGNEQNFSVTKKTIYLDDPGVWLRKILKVMGKSNSVIENLTDNCTHLARSVSMWSAQ